MNDGELIHSILEGNQRDYERLIQQYHPNVFRTAMGLLHNKEDAEEVTQDVFIKVYQSLSTFTGKSAFSTWLYRITVNTSLNFIRKKKRQKIWVNLSSLFQQPSADKQPEILVSEKSEKEIIQRAIESLQEKQRIAFVLAKYEELPQKQVAQVMDITEGAVEQLLLRAKTNLKKILEKKLQRP